MAQHGAALTRARSRASDRIAAELRACLLAHHRRGERARSALRARRAVRRGRRSPSALARDRERDRAPQERRHRALTATISCIALGGYDVRVEASQGRAPRDHHGAQDGGALLHRRRARRSPRAAARRRVERARPCANRAALRVFARDPPARSFSRRRARRLIDTAAVLCGRLGARRDLSNAICEDGPAPADSQTRARRP